MISDFLTRTTAATLAGLNPDGTARRATLVYAPGGALGWALREGDDAEQHAKGALEFLLAAQGRSQGRADGVSQAPPSTEPRLPPAPPWGAQTAALKYSRR